MSSIITIFRKEISTFFNSLIGYIVIGVFLVGVGLFFWIFEGNILETGISGMDALFDFGPYLFLFLLPAVTMRAFAEEAKAGTMELLFTKPITDWQIILGKYLAALFLVLFALLPTLLYMLSVYWLGILDGGPQSGGLATAQILSAPAQGDSTLDMGATWGAYIGLFFLGGIFAAIGLLTSALTRNQIESFVLGVFGCFFFFVGFDFLAGIKALDAINAFFLRLGILDHYSSISRGVVDSRDLLYFISFIVVCLVLTHWVIRRKRP